MYTTLERWCWPLGALQGSGRKPKADAQLPGPHSQAALLGLPLRRCAAGARIRPRLLGGHLTGSGRTGTGWNRLLCTCCADLRLQVSLSQHVCLRTHPAATISKLDAAGSRRAWDVHLGQAVLGRLGHAGGGHTIEGAVSVNGSASGGQVALMGVLVLAPCPSKWHCSTSFLHDECSLLLGCIAALRNYLGAGRASPWTMPASTSQARRAWLCQDRAPAGSRKMHRCPSGDGCSRGRWTPEASRT